jgi:small basic protein (TIGR04137 family)
MTVDRSLKRKGKLVRARNVLKRDERIAKLRENEIWQEGRSPLGLPKVRVQKANLGKKKKKKEEGDEAAAATAGAAAPAAPAAGAKAPAGKAPAGKAPAGKPAPGKK